MTDFNPTITPMVYTREEVDTIIKNKLQENLITWDASFDMNNIITQGIYYISGERVSLTDNLPIQNTGYIGGQINVLEANGCISQFLKLTNAGGSEGKEYIRTYANGSWSMWRELKQTANLGQVSDEQLKTIVDNGHYEGAILNLEDLAGGTNIFATYLQAFLDTIQDASIGYNRLISGSLFSMEVLNNYAVVKEAESWGRTFDRAVTQIVKVQMIHGQYVEVQRSKIGDNAFGNWKMVNVF